MNKCVRETRRKGERQEEGEIRDQKRQGDGEREQERVTKKKIFSQEDCDSAKLLSLVSSCRQ